MANSKNRARLDARVERLMADTKWDWARSDSSMRFLSALATIAAIATPVAFWFSNLAGLISALLLITLFAILQSALRGVADLPERYLDERQRSVRNAIYLKAYQYLASFLGLVTVILFALAGYIDGSSQEFVLELSFHQISALAWAILGPVMIIPNVSLALMKGTR